MVHVFRLLLICKKCWFVLILLTAFLKNESAAQIQDTVVIQKKFIPSTSVGFKAGYNLSQISFSPPINQDFTRSITAGLILNHFAQPYAGIQVELNYLQAGWTLSENGDSRRFNYLEVPVFTHIQIGKKNGAFLLNLGPYISFLISKRDSLLLPETANTNQTKLIPNRLQYGLAFGLGYLQKTAVGNFQFEARFAYGLGNVLTPATSPNQAITACIGYLLERKRKK
ncbi:PorT family protein [Adhaeribacter swui]|uniref:PorT family protein n=1 Tax=Adhaeribacter swui TaxID=2086471 RepID=A0A7G7G7T2_9BACT|nr:porin family protein [Adhaeribacter swui]QNF33216.1 PorT family protein [Adhaeribacter swui]